MAKKTYVIWYDVIETYKVYFDAESLAEAQKFVAEVDLGNQPIEWLSEAHNGSEKVKNITVEFDTNSLEEI